MSDHHYDLTIQFVDHFGGVYEGEEYPRRTYYRATAIRGPGHSPDLSQYVRKSWESPTIKQWDDGPSNPPTSMMGDHEAFVQLLEHIAWSLRASSTTPPAPPFRTRPNPGQPGRVLSTNRPTTNTMNVDKIAEDLWEWFDRRIDREPYLGKTEFGSAVRNTVRRAAVNGYSRRTGRFRIALTALLKSHSMEEGSNTADHVLSQYLIDCLRAFDRAHVAQQESDYQFRLDGGLMRPPPGPDGDDITEPEH